MFDATSKVACWGGAVLLIVLLAGCSTDMAVEVKNTQAAREVARTSQSGGSVYVGWRVYQSQCVGCHGPDAAGMVGGPNLLPLVQDMGPRQFVSLVLERYDWNHAVRKAPGDSRSRQSAIEQALQRKDVALVMPAWGGEPSVSAHILDLYAYLSARAHGTQGPGRPD